MLLLVLATLTTSPMPTPPNPPAARLLVFSKTAGFRHGAIPVAQRAMQKMASDKGFTVDVTEDSAAFTRANLAKYDGVVFLLTTGDVLNREQEQAFERYVTTGGGFLGVHSAADTEYDWPFYGNVLGGGYFMSHPQIQDADIRVENRQHPTTKMLPETWRRRDEWYDYKTSPRGKATVLASLNPKSYQGSKMPGDHPIIWCREVGRGRAWYTGLGHTDESYSEPLFLDSLYQAVQWVTEPKRRQRKR